MLAALTLGATGVSGLSFSAIASDAAGTSSPHPVVAVVETSVAAPHSEVAAAFEAAATSPHPEGAGASVDVVGSPHAGAAVVADP